MLEQNDEWSLTKDALCAVQPVRQVPTLRKPYADLCRMADAIAVLQPDT